MMRKRIVVQFPINDRAQIQGRWVDLEQIATVEVTSEAPNYQVESVFVGKAPGWRALEKGEQRIRLIFDELISVKRIRLRFVEAEVERTQEFTLKWLAAEGS